MATRDLAILYHERGWHPLPLPARAKEPPPVGRTGYGTPDMTRAEIEQADWAGNLAVRMPPDVIGLDVDVYHGGDETLAELLAKCGPLPATVISHSGRNDGSGIRFYRVPPGLAWVPGLPGIEVIQRNHRYAVAFPSIHPEGRRYGYADQAECRFTTEVPAVEDLPELPWPWIAELSRADRADVSGNGQASHAVDVTELAEFLDAHDRADAPSYISEIVAHFEARWRAGYSRHDTMQHCLIWAMECVAAGVASARPTVAQLALNWVTAIGPDARRAEVTSGRRTTEFEAMLRHAVGKVTAKSADEVWAIRNAIVGPTMAVPANAVSAGTNAVIDVYKGDPAILQSSPFLDWAAFANRDPDSRHWLVEGFWPAGRAMALWAGAKTGKSELALWCAAKLALGEHPWSGDPVEPVDVVYLDYEMTEDDLDDRLAAFGIDPTRLGHLHYALLPPLHALDDERGGAEVEALVVAVGAQAVVIDTFSRAVSGEENEADTVRSFYRHTGSRLKRLGVGYLRTDHAGKDPTKGQRGSSAKRDDVDVVWKMSRAASGLSLSCTGSSRLSWVDPHLVVERTEANGLLAYSSAMRMGWPAGTAEKVAQLDRLGVPLDAPRRAARETLHAAGLTPGRNQILAAALKFRREQGSVKPGTTVSSSSPAGPDEADGD